MRPLFRAPHHADLAAGAWHAPHDDHPLPFRLVAKASLMTPKP